MDWKWHRTSYEQDKMPHYRETPLIIRFPLKDCSARLLVLNYSVAPSDFRDATGSYEIDKSSLPGERGLARRREYDFFVPRLLFNFETDVTREGRTKISVPTTANRERLIARGEEGRERERGDEASSR